MNKILKNSAILIIIDQFIKILVTYNMKLNNSIIIIPSFFNITYVENNGAAFSILSGNRIFIITLTFIIIYFLFKHLSKNKDLKPINTLIYVLLISGIFGNLIDRIIRGCVVDYLDFNLFKYAFPIFNLADIFIVIGCILLIIISLKEEQHENNSKARR